MEKKPVDHLNREVQKKKQKQIKLEEYINKINELSLLATTQKNKKQTKEQKVIDHLIRWLNRAEEAIIICSDHLTEKQVNEIFSCAVQKTVDGLIENNINVDIFLKYKNGILLKENKLCSHKCKDFELFDRYVRYYYNLNYDKKIGYKEKKVNEVCHTKLLLNKLHFINKQFNKQPTLSKDKTILPKILPKRNPNIRKRLYYNEGGLYSEITIGRTEQIPSIHI